MVGEGEGMGVIECVRSGAMYGGDNSYELVTNTWLFGDDQEVVVIDPANDAHAILDAVGDRRVSAVLCTNGTVDHVNAAPAVAQKTGAPVYLHSVDARFWAGTNGERPPDATLSAGQVLMVARQEIDVLHTPGYTRGSCCFYVPGRAMVFSGDTLGLSAPELGSPFSDPVVQLESIRQCLLVLPSHTEVRRGHGDTTRIGDHHDQGIS